MNLAAFRKRVEAHERRVEEHGKRKRKYWPPSPPYSNDQAERMERGK